jgi:hypothetical protein
MSEDPKEPRRAQSSGWQARLTLANGPRLAWRWYVVGLRLWLATLGIVLSTVLLRLGLRAADDRPRRVRVFLERSGGAWI